MQNLVFKLFQKTKFCVASFPKQHALNTPTSRDIFSVQASYLTFYCPLPKRACAQHHFLQHRSTYHGVLFQSAQVEECASSDCIDVIVV